MANSSYYASGKTTPGPTREFTPAVDKNPIYRTNDTFKRAYKKNIRVEEGQYNQTDCTTTVWVKFSDPIDWPVIEDLGVVRTRNRYRLGCGHEWEGKKEASIGSVLPCFTCGAEQGYLGFEHEWQHILFKTDPKAARLFINAWIEELRKKAPYVDKEQLEPFLFYVLNCFDDIRCNSLWELLYPGSADRIWKRWTRLSNSRSVEDNSANFICYLFAVALGTPTTPDGPYEQMRPYIEWGMRNVRYKGYQRALAVARLALDACIGILLTQMQPPQQQGGSDNGAIQGGAQPQPGDSQSTAVGDAGGEAGGDAQRDAGDLPGDGGVPSLGSGADPTQVSNAISSLLRHSSQFDTQENHPAPSKVDPVDISDAMRAGVVQAMQTDTDDPEVWMDMESGEGDVDPWMQAAIDDFRDGVTPLSPDSQLMADAKAKLLFIDVLPEGIDSQSRVVLSVKEQEGVGRMRGIFFRTLGRQKARRSATGGSIDLDAAIQYDVDPNDPEIFEEEQNNQGFAYLTLCDMSGSMSGRPFQQVAHATEMLKQSLHFPFVDGSLWGFRGGAVGKAVSNEVWLYRYAKNCSGYLGTAKAAYASGKTSVRSYPVRCDGLTPMHTAVRVAVRHLLTQVSPGMAKRLFLLTDGSPCSVKMDGKGLPHWVLQQYVAKEIQWARQRGIHVYTLVIGGELAESECRAMFGPPQYWKVASVSDDENSVDRVLQDLVIQNFQKYLRSRA